MFPAGYQNDKLAKFITDFYAASDTRPPAEGAGHDKYLDFFTEDANVHIRADAKGHKELIPFRQNMWKGISNRKHTIYQVCPFSPKDAEQQEVMLRGEVQLLKEGEAKPIATEWAGWALFAPNKIGNDAYKMQDYRVYMA